MLVMSKTIDPPWMDESVVIGDFMHHVLENKLTENEKRHMIEVFEELASNSGGDELRLKGSNEASQLASEELLNTTKWGAELANKLSWDVSQAVLEHIIEQGMNPSTVQKSTHSIARNVATKVGENQEEIQHLLENASGMYM